MYLFLGVVILAGLGLRTWNVNFDGGLNAHPDERSTTCNYAPTIGWPSSFNEFRDPQRSRLNPLWDRHNDRHHRPYTYGHFPLYLGILTGELLSDLAKPVGFLPLPDRTITLMERSNTPCHGVAFAGRLMMALLDTLSIFLLFLLGRRLYGAAAGLLAATLYAFTAQAVQLSHFFAMDPSSTTFVVLSVYGGVLMVQDRSWRGVFWAGIGAGLAISAKFSAMPILAVPIVAALIVMRATANSDRVQGRKRSAGLFFSSILIFLLLAFAAFLITSPYAILDWQNFINATLVQQGRIMRGAVDIHFTRRFRDSTPYLHFIQQQVVWGMGWPLGSTALAGSAWALARAAFLKARRGELIVWAWVLPYFGITGAFLAKFNRYMSPVLPFVLLFAAGLAVWLWKLGAKRHLPLAARLPAALLVLVAVGGGLFWSLAYVNGIYAREYTWIPASRWVHANVPAGSVILWERIDDTLPTSLPGEPGIDINSLGLRNLYWSSLEEDTQEKLEDLRYKLNEADYVIFSSNRNYQAVDELPERYPMTIRYYDLMFGGQLGFALTAEFASYPRLLGLAFPDQKADISWTEYDHPLVSIYAKQRDFDDAKFQAQMDGYLDGAIPHYLGRVSPLTTLLDLLNPLASGLSNALRGSALPEKAESKAQDIKADGSCVPLLDGNALCYCGNQPFAVEPSALLKRLLEGQPTTLGDANKDLVTLLGWEIKVDERPQPTDTVKLRLYWQPHGHVTTELHSFAHLYAPSIQHSWAVAQNFYPSCQTTTEWHSGNIYVDDLHLTIPLDTPPTNFSLVAGLVSADGDRLTVIGSPDNLLHLATLEVEPIRTDFFQRKRFLWQPMPSIAALADTNDGLRLLGYDLLPAPGAPTLRLYWETTGHVDNDWITYIHLHDPGGERLAQFDGPPLTGLKPTSSWQIDALYIDRRQLILPTDLEPDTYLIRLGLYSPSSGERLPFQPEFSDVQGQFEGGQLLVPLSLSGETENGPDY